jgi:hypothetical protein
MDELTALYLAIVALYLIECGLIVRRGGGAFVRRFGRSWMLAEPFTPIEGRDFGVLPGNPLPPLGVVLGCRPWSIAVSPLGLRTRPVASVDETIDARAPTRFVPFDQLERLRSEGDLLHVNGRPFARMATASDARETAVWLRDLRDTPEDRRAAIIERRLKQSLDACDAVQLLKRYRRETVYLRVLCHVMLVYTFVGIPLIGMYAGLSGTWRYVLAAFLAIWFSTIVEFYLAHRALYREDAAARRERAALLLLTPLATIRACDYLARPIPGRTQPIGLALALLPRADADELAGRMLRHLTYPLPGESDGDDDDGGSDGALVMDWFRSRWRAAVTEFLASHGVDLKACLAPPARDGDASIAFCPRCRLQVIFAEGNCPHCPGILVVAFDAMRRDSRDQDASHNPTVAAAITAASSTGPDPN